MHVADGVGAFYTGTELTCPTKSADRKRVLIFLADLLACFEVAKSLKCFHGF